MDNSTKKALHEFIDSFPAETQQGLVCLEYGQSVCSKYSNTLHLLVRGLFRAVSAKTGQLTLSLPVYLWGITEKDIIDFNNLKSRFVFEPVGDELYILADTKAVIPA